MNHILRLQGELRMARAALLAMGESLRAFRAHLEAEKFKGYEADGSRKDWIAVADVDARLREIIAMGFADQENAETPANPL